MEALLRSDSCQRELKMAAERRRAGAEPSSADGGRAAGCMAGFEGSSLLGWKWIREQHNGSLRRVCGTLLKPCLLCPGSFMPSGACGRQLPHAAFLIVPASPAPPARRLRLSIHQKQELTCSTAPLFSFVTCGRLWN